MEICDAYLITLTGEFFIGVKSRNFLPQSVAAAAERPGGDGRVVRLSPKVKLNRQNSFNCFGEKYFVWTYTFHLLHQCFPNF